MPDVTDLLTNAINAQEAALRTTVPVVGDAALVALVRAQDRLQDRHDRSQAPAFDLIHGSALTNPGGSLALSVGLGTSRGGNRFAADRESIPSSREVSANLDHWATEFLSACTHLADAKQVLAHLASGFMRGEFADDGSVNAWIAQQRFPPAWRERIDLAWWDARSHHQGENDPIQALGWQFGYLPDAIVAGLPAHIWTNAVRALHERCASVEPPIQASDLRDHLVEKLGIGLDAAASILSAVTLDESNAAWHATVPGIATAPLIRLSPTTLFPSQLGLQTQPLLFLARELRRRDPQRWHNAAHQREAAFRHDLLEIFADKRFIHAPTRIQLKRDGGTLRTDIDAAIFDRKTGTLALFELKSQDPFSRSQDELDRRRDNVLAANRQLSGILDWTKRHKPDEILDRIDHQTAKRFHVQRVLPFVLARTLVHFNDGPAPDKRAAWGTWPDVLRLHDVGILAPTTANPLQALFTRLQGWPGDPPISPETLSRTLHVGDLTMTVSATRPTK